LRSERADFAIEFIDIEKAAGLSDIWWEGHQLAFLGNTGRFGIDVKARQIAWSFTAALDAVVDARLHPNTPHIFVSINLDEAKEKIRYAKAIVDAMDEPVRPLLVRESQTEIEFENGSRLVSHPCRPPRGKAGARIYLDEMAHYREGLDREIYRGALPATVRGEGYIRIGSSPMGASGLFWEIASEALKPYPGYTGHRRFIYWWLVEALCKDVETARQVAPEMATEERVYAFGTPPLVEIFENMFLEDFQAEYECHVGSTQVCLANGEKIPVSNLAVGDEVLYRSASETLPCRVIKKVSMGIRDTLRVVTEAGTELQATADHKVVTSAGKTELKDAEDLCYVWARIYSPSRQDALARVVGYNLGDGHVSRRGTGNYQVSWFSNQKSDMELLAHDLAQSDIVTGLPRVCKKGDEGYVVYVSAPKASRALVESGCIVGAKKYQPLSVPHWIMAGTPSVKREFMAALWGAEGTTPIVRSVARICNNPVLSMWKERKADGELFFSQLGSILDEFSIDHTTTIAEKAGGIRYSLYVSRPASNILRFFDLIGFRYAEDKERVCFYWRHYLGAYLYDSEHRRRVIRRLHQDGLSYSEIGKRLGMCGANAHRLLQKPPTRPRADFPHFPEWKKKRAGDDCIFLKITERYDGGAEEVFNLSVDSPDESYLLADGLDNYNCSWIDESVAWITWELIKTNQALHVRTYWHAKSATEALDLIPTIQKAIADGRIEPALTGGIDVGRKRNLTEFVVLGYGERYPVRLMVSLDRVEYDEQEDCFRALIARLPFTQVLVDQNGIGAQLAENLERTGKAQGVDFTSATKELWAVESKIQFERGNVPLPLERDLAYQIHSIKKTVTAAKNVRYDTERNEAHHADKLWALALAIWAASGKAETRKRAWARAL